MFTLIFNPLSEDVTVGEEAITLTRYAVPFANGYGTFAVIVIGCRFPNGLIVTEPMFLGAVKLPAGIDGEKLVKIMRDTHGVTVAGGQDQLKGKIIRLAHMGALDEYDVLTGLACLEKVLHQMGHKIELGASLTAAQKIFNA